MGVSSKHKLVVICGPTASGKTGLGIALARRFGGEIISADSMQIYRRLNVGTAKPTPEEQAAVPHHLIDFLEPEQPYSVADYVAQAGERIEEIAAKGRQPFVVGGTGLYISSLIRGVRFAPQKGDPALRERLQGELEQLGPQAMYDRLAALDPQAAAATHPNNHVRVLRALEMVELEGKPATLQKQEAIPEESPYEVLCLCLEHSDRQQLYARIEKRIDIMMKEGLLTEAELVYRNRETYKTAAQAIGYKEFFPYFTGEQTLEACVERLKQATRNYAKRQLTWFRRMPEVTWLQIDDPEMEKKAIRLVEEFLGGEH